MILDQVPIVSSPSIENELRCVRFLRANAVKLIILDQTYHPEPKFISILSTRKANKHAPKTTYFDPPSQYTSDGNCVESCVTDLRGTSLVLTRSHVLGYEAAWALLPRQRVIHLRPSKRSFRLSMFHSHRGQQTCLRICARPHQLDFRTRGKRSKWYYIGSLINCLISTYLEQPISEGFGYV